MNFDDSDEALMNFYDVKSVHPQSIRDTYRSIDLPTDLGSKIDNVDDCFSLLNQIINVDDQNDLVMADDDEDPLIGGSMMNALFHKGLLKNEHDEERLKYFVTSKKFDSINFLTRIHNKDSLNNLLGSLNYLESSIDKQSKGLRRLIDSKFLKFVNTKNSIDDILIKFSNNLNESNNFKLTHLEQSVAKLNLNSSMAIKPIIEIKNKQSKINQLINFINGKKYFFNLPSILNNYLMMKDYDNLVHDYKNFKLMQKTYLMENNNQVSSIIDRVWEEVETIMDIYKKRVYKQLISINFEQDIVKNASNRSNVSNLNSSKNFLNLVNKLHDIGIEDNPMLEFLTLQITNLQKEFLTHYQKFEKKFILNKVKLNESLRTSDVSYIVKLHDDMESNNGEVQEDDELYDSFIILETWLLVTNFIDYFKDQFTVKFSKIWSNILYLKNYKFTSTSYTVSENEAKLNLNEQELETIKTTCQDLILLVSETLIKFFNLNDDVENLHDKTSTKKYGFLPRYANSVSSTIYLHSVSNNIATSLSRLASFDINSKITDLLRNTNSIINSRIVEAVCSVWLKDCHKFSELEKWDLQNGGVTKMPKIVTNYELFLLNKIYSLIFWQQIDNFEVKVIAYPSKKLLAGIKVQFLKSLDIIIESLMKSILIEDGEKNPEHQAIHNLFHKQIPDNYKVEEIYKLLTVNNLREIKERSYITLLAKFDKSFKDNLQSGNLKIFSIIDKFDATLFENYLLVQKSIIRQKIKKGFTEKWTVQKTKSTKISNYIYEILIHLTSLYTKLAPISIASYNKIVAQLQQIILKLILESTKELGEITKFTALTIKLDLIFLESTFGDGDLALNDYCLNLIDIIFKSVNSEYAQLKMSDQELIEIVEANMKDSETQFSCFSNNTVL